MKQACALLLGGNGRDNAVEIRYGIVVWPARASRTQCTLILAGCAHHYTPRYCLFKYKLIELCVYGECPDHSIPGCELTV